MGIYKTFIDGLKDCVDLLGSYETGIIGYFLDLNTGTVNLPPIKISLVAPSGFGKTTLISTIMKEINVELASGNVGKRYKMSVRPKEDSDKARLLECDKKIDQAIQAGSGKMTTISIAGSGEIARYDFEIVLSTEDERTELIQPFFIMDIPGGWIDPRNRVGDINKRWEEFEAHLKDSRILWIPVDSVALYSARTNSEKEYRARLLNTTDVENIAVEWAQSQSDKESCICFAPVKCESYHLYEENSRDSKATAFRKIFDDMFSGIENTVHKVNPSVRMFYVPVETVGCIKNVTHDWHVGEALEFHADYTITGIRREIKGADRLLSKVYEYAYEQITDENAKTEKMIEIQEGKASIFQKSKIVKERKFFEKCKSLLEPIILVFGKYSADVANNNRPEEIVV